MAEAKNTKADVDSAVRFALSEWLHHKANGLRFSQEPLTSLGIGNADMDFLLEEIAEHLNLATEAFHGELKIDYDAEPIDTVGQLQDRVLAAIQKVVQ